MAASQAVAERDVAEEERECAASESKHHGVEHFRASQIDPRGSAEIDWQATSAVIKKKCGSSDCRINAA
jgi:hypothetical protein